MTDTFTCRHMQLFSKNRSLLQDMNSPASFSQLSKDPGLVHFRMSDCEDPWLYISNRLHPHHSPRRFRRLRYLRTAPHRRRYYSHQCADYCLPDSR